MTEVDTLCPYCGETLTAGEATCPACQENLAGLISLEKRHLLLYNEAVDAARVGDWAGAILALQMSLRARADFGPGFKLLAKVYAADGQWAKAREMATQAATLLPDDASITALLAEIERAEAGLATERKRTQPPVVSLNVNGAAAASAEQKDLVAAFGAGAAFVSLFVFIVALLRGGRD